MQFIEASAFTRHLSEYMSDESYRAMQLRLAENPEMGDVIPGTGGFRKARWADERRGKGKRGGVRVIYYHFPQEQEIWLLTIYGKDETADLTVKQKKALSEAIARELEERVAARSRRTRRRT